MDKKTLIFATGNQGKVNEFKQMLGDEFEILSMKDLDVDVDIVEDGKTFEENAVIKAKTVCEATGRMVLADDSGFEVDALGGEPGIYSSRFYGGGYSVLSEKCGASAPLRGCARRGERRALRVRHRMCLS